MTKRNQDNRVTALYDAENWELPPGSRFETTEQVQSFVDMITATPYWSKQGNVPKKINVFSNGDADESRAGSDNEVWLAIKHRHEQAVLHELAHFLAPATCHGPAFVRAYLGLLREFRGNHWASLYRDAFRRVGVRF